VLSSDMDTTVTLPSTASGSSYTFEFTFVSI
jgi:hypothetical protein